MPTLRTDFFKLGDIFATVIGDDVKVGIPRRSERRGYIFFTSD